MEVCRPDAQILTLFQTPNYYFKTCNRPKLSHHYLVWNANKKNRNPFLIRMFLFLSYSFGTEIINSFLNSSRRSLENHTRFQTKMGKVYTRLQTETAQKPYPLGRHIPSMRASSPIGRASRERACPSRLRRSLACSRETRFARPNRRACSQARTYLYDLHKGVPSPPPPVWRKLVPGRGVSRQTELPWRGQHFLTNLGEQLTWETKRLVRLLGSPI